MSVLYIKIPKTATTTIKRALNLEHLNGYPTYQRVNPSKDVYSFTFVRNTYKRLVSWFRHHNGVDIEEFREWVKNDYPHNWKSDWIARGQENNPLNQMNWITDTDGNVVVDFIGTVGNIDEDYKQLCEELEIENPNPLPHLIPTPEVEEAKKQKDFNPKDYYDEETRKKVEEDFKEEIEYFNFKFFGE